MMKVHAGKGLTQAASNVFVLIDDEKRPQMLIGEIFPQSSDGRDSPPDCYSGFDTAGTAFAKGHIMALELGGCDDSENIVPQYGQWQGNQNGAWRKMEKAVYEHAVSKGSEKQVLVVACNYPSGATMVTLEERAAYLAGEKLRHFTDPRIPLRFKVWVVPKTWASKSGKVTVEAFFKATEKATLFTGLFLALGTEVAPVFEETITEMPAIDREYWKAQMLNAKVREAYDRYVADQKQKLDDWLASQTGGSQGGGGGKMRTPRRATAMSRVGAMPYTSSPQPADPLNLAKWAQDQKNREAVITWLKGPPPQLSGWNDVEIALLQQQHVESAVFK
jgi:hypothetical protein